MRRYVPLLVVVLALASVSEGAVINTSNPAEVAAFQAGATVVNFESVPTRTPLPITAYTAGVDVPPAATVFNEIAGARFSVGGMVGTNEPALYSLTGGIAGDARSPSTVLGPVDFEFKTLFGAGGALIEIFFPAKVAKVGFWLNPSLGNVQIIAVDNLFAFSGDPDENNLETGNGTAGNFAGIQRPTADIGGFKILAAAGNTAGFTIDDFTVGGASTQPPPSTVPEPATLTLMAVGSLIGAGLRSRQRRR